jgi:uncharacterized protein (TIGR00251 family)
MTAASSLQLEPHADGVILPVRAQAGARRNGIKGIHAGALQVAVTQAPEKGKANKAIIEVLAVELHLKKSQIELLSGETASQKRFLISGIGADDLVARISGLPTLHSAK